MMKNKRTPIFKNSVAHLAMPDMEAREFEEGPVWGVNITK
jgi:hypothetical protein